jgi:MFS transporter, OPA family, sugar phosphate sensor protein UhpC
VSQERRQRNLVWGVTWLAYASYYLGRKGFSAAKHSLKSEGVLDTSALGVIDTAYLAAYSLGQFTSGVLGDRVGARRLIGYGLLLSAGLCAAFGSLSSALLLALVFTLNGLVQASGWPGTTRAMAEWTTPENRGTVMGLWSTCYQVGPFLAGPFAGVLIARYGWRSAFHVPAVIMALVALLVLWLVVPGPRHADTARLSEQEDTAVASAFEGGGLFGVIAMGALSDRLKVGRVALSALALLGLSLALFAGAKWVGPSTGLNVALLALIGAFLVAPDSILCGAAAQDAGGRNAAAMATGFVNGVGSIGAFVEGLTVPLLAKRFGWQALFPCLVGMAVLGALCLLPALGVKRRPLA